MIKTSAKEIAKYFRESVAFDFTKTTITSYQQILRERDGFYSLLDKSAFSALLNDCLYFDNQLVDIFMDLYDAELGIHKFADKRARETPRQFITHFLNEPKYVYHQSDVAKVYIAVNTWLVFFGENEIAAQWTKCPFCGSSVTVSSNSSTGVCSNKSCKRTSADFVSAATQLYAMLQTELSGKLSATPKFYDGIKDGSEFYLAYKSRIEQIRQKRFLEEQGELDRAHYVKQRKEFDNAVLSLIKMCATFEAELKSASLKVAEVRKLLVTADELYSAISAGVKAGFKYAKAEYGVQVQKFANELRAKVVTYVGKGERRNEIFDQQSKLASKVNTLLMELNACTPSDNKASVYAKRFADEIDKSKDFALLRAEDPEKYSEVTDPFRKKLQLLQQAEKKLKVENFVAEASSLHKKATNALPRHGKAVTFTQIWIDITNRYQSLSSNSEFRKWKSLIEPELGRLASGEDEIVNERRKRKGKAKAICIVLAVLLVASALGVFTCEWAGMLPEILLAESADGFFGQTNGSYITITGVSDDRKQLIIDNNTRLPWSFNEKTITAIGTQAFMNNLTLETVKLPPTITSIESQAFANCSALKQVYLASATPPEVSDDSFSNFQGVIYVPEYNYEAYLNDESWSQYEKNIFPDYNNDEGYGCILFDSDGGTAVNNIRSHLLNSVAPELPVPIRQAYNFAGWYLSDGTSVQSGSTVISRDIKLKARWTPVQYKIMYELNGGEITTNINGYDVENRVVLPEPTRYSYTFDGWYTNPQFDGSATKEIAAGSTGDVTLYAKWLPNVYKIKFISLYVTNAEENWHVGQEVNFPAPSAPSEGKFASGYMFAGWSTSFKDDGNGDNDIKNVISWDTIPELGESGQIIALYAVWETTPTEWFVIGSDEQGNGAYIAGLTSAWEDYDGYLDKYNLYIPTVQGDLSVCTIKADAFAANESIKFVNIPETVTRIEENAFSGCVNLKSVTGGENVEYLGKNAFKDTYWFDNLWDNGSWFLSIGKVLIKYNRLGGTNVAKVNIPDHVTILGYGLFKDCNSSVADGTLIIPDNITEIYDEAFANCGELNITLREGIAYGFDVFAGVSVNVLTIPNSTFNFDGVFKWTSQPEELKIAQLTMGFETASSLSLTGHSYMAIGVFDAAELNLTSVMLSDFGRVGTLNLNHNQLTSATLTGFGQVGTLNLNNNALTSVNLSDIDSIGTLNLYQNALSTVNLDNIPVTSIDLTENTLRRLDITNIKATRLMLAGNLLEDIICSSVNEAVKIIYAPSGGSFTDPILSNIAFAANLPNLWSLDVANNKIYDITPLANLTELRELYLGGNPVLNISEQIEYLAEYGFCSQLNRLNLGGGTATTAILNVVSKCTNLTWLQIYGINASMSEITNVIKQSTHSKLQYLKISHNGFTTVPSGLDYIKTVVVGYEDYRQDV